LAESGMKQRLAAILAADAAGYTRLMAEDQAATVAALDAARAVFRAEAGSHQGRIVDTAGDSVLAIFGTAAGAIHAAQAIQAKLQGALRFRIGVHLGDVIEKSDGTIYGDGVNVASRLQALAAPGGIVVSGAVHSVADNRDLALDDLGERKLKNIAEPVRAYAVRAAGHARRPRRRFAAAAAASALVVAVVSGLLWQRSSPEPSAPLALPAKPSIAVLPFENMGGDPEQSYFADGMTDDLITDLSKVEGLFVIARNSTFAYKSKSRDVREIARALGVRYVLEGSVRRSGGEVRINAQLIDAGTGGHVWADRYDGDMKNIFGLQDKVARNVVAALAVELTKDDSARVARRGTSNAQAYDVFLKGWQRYLQQTPQDFRAAVAHFKQALELDPTYGRAHAALAATYWETAKRVWDVPLGFRHIHLAQFEAEQHLAKAMRDPTPLAHEVASAMLLQARQHEEAIAEARKAIASDPNDADGYVTLAAALTFSGKPDEAAGLVERAMRLNPHYPSHYLHQKALAQFGMKRLEAAAATLERALTLNPDDYWSQRLLLATYGLLGRNDRAGMLLQQAMKASEPRGSSAFHDPLTIKAVAYWHPFAKPGDAENFADGLRRAGVPD
jgi:TolB-like protein/class 3 adenylate cyclase